MNLLEMAGIAGNGWNWPGCVQFWPLVLNMNGFNDDDE